MSTYNIEMNMLNSSNGYDVLYPKTDYNQLINKPTIPSIPSLPLSISNGSTGATTAKDIIQNIGSQLKILGDGYMENAGYMLSYHPSLQAFQGVLIHMKKIVPFTCYYKEDLQVSTSNVFLYGEENHNYNSYVDLFVLKWTRGTLYLNDINLGTNCANINSSTQWSNQAAGMIFISNNDKFVCGNIEVPRMIPGISSIGTNIRVKCSTNTVVYFCYLSF